MDEMVQMVFLIAVPENNIGKSHLKIISSVSKKLLNDNFRKELLIEKDARRIYKLLSSINN